MSALRQHFVQVDPRELTGAELSALRTVAGWRLTRVHNGWRAAGSPTVTLKMAERLAAKGLIRRNIVVGKSRLEVTGTGYNTLSVADVRRRS